MDRTKKIIASVLLVVFLSFYGDYAWAKARKVECVYKRKGKWQLLVDKKPFFIKGVVYNFAVVGDDPDAGTLRDWSILDLNNNGKNDLAYDSWVDSDYDNNLGEGEEVLGDWRLLRDMGCNAIRVYQMPSCDKRLEPMYREKGAQLTFYHPSNKEIFRDLAQNYGIMVIIGHFFGEWTIGTGAQWMPGVDYTDPLQRARLLDCVRVMVEEHKDEPYTLMWMLGNENFNPYDHDNAERQVEPFLTLVNEAANLIHKLDPNHPVALCNWGLDHLKDIKKYCPDLDIIGINSYLKELTPIYQTAQKEFNRPVLISEYGFSAWSFRRPDEEAQARAHEFCWRSIENNAYGRPGVGNSIGAAAFIWCDMWCLGGDSFIHNTSSYFGMEGIEWFGISAQGDGSKSPFLRQLRLVYYKYQELWR